MSWNTSYDEANSAPVVKKIFKMEQKLNQVAVTLKYLI